MGFFDDLSKKASETYKNTAEKTSKLTREMKLKSLINEDKNQIQKIYCEIGKIVYEKHIREENIDIKTELVEECSKIDAYAKEIEDMNTEMRALKNLRLCKKCGAEIALSAKFCPSCGAAQEEEPQVSEVVAQEPQEPQASEMVVQEPQNLQVYQNSINNEKTEENQNNVNIENSENTANYENTTNN